MTFSNRSHNFLTLESLASENVLVCGMRMAPNLSLLVASEPHAENTHFSSFELCWCLYTKSMYHEHTPLFLGFYFPPLCSIPYVPVRILMQQCVNYCSFVRSLKSGSSSLRVVTLLTFYLNILCLCISK